MNQIQYDVIYFGVLTRVKTKKKTEMKTTLLKVSFINETTNLCV